MGRPTAFPLFFFRPEKGLFAVKPSKQEGTRRPGLCQQQRSATSFIPCSMKSVAMVVAVALLFAPRPAVSMTADGALMTNTALATFSGLGGIGTAYRISYLASVNVLICNPIIGYVKNATPTMVAPTETVTFTVCTMNNSVTTSAFNVIITDQIPGNMAYVAGGWPAGLPNTWGGTNWFAYNSVSINGPWVAGMPAVGTSNSFLRWMMQINVGPGVSACVTYRATVL